MRREVKAVLHDALKAGDDIERYTTGLEYEDYNDDDQLQAAVERKFEIIGEALNRALRFDPTALDVVTEHDRIIGFRNVISHGYDVVDNRLIWDAVRNHLPRLRQEPQQLTNGPSKN